MVTMSERQIGEENQKKSIDFCPNVLSFKTDRGSVYEKMPDGLFARHKYNGEDHEPLEFTLFIDKKEMKKSLYSYNNGKFKDIPFGNENYEITLSQDINGEADPIYSRSDVINPHKINIDIFEVHRNENGAIDDIVDFIDTIPVSLVPFMGAKVFETSLTKKEGYVPFGIANHMGHDVSEITEKS
jgi:hypothetical protein